MPRKQKLKVYRTPIGFHDAYVAAPSQKAALKAWGSDADLFSRAAAELVTDEKLTGKPLARLGTVVRRPRDTNDEYIAALPEVQPPPKRRTPPEDKNEGPPPRRRRSTETGPPARRRRSDDGTAPPAKVRAMAKLEPDATPTPKAKPRSTPRPSRTRLDEAEKALEKVQSDHDEKIAGIRKREQDLQQERRILEARHEQDVAKPEATLAKVRERYGEALKKWRGA